MINNILAAATAQAIEDFLKTENIPYIFRNDEEYKYFKKVWEETDSKEMALAMRQAKPAFRRIASKEPYLFLTDGEPVAVRFNYLDRTLEKDSFGEIMLERPDLDWRISISIKSDARVITALPVADHIKKMHMDKVVNVFNEIDDFGYRILGIPCSNEYFTDMNDILMAFEPYSQDEWNEKTKDDSFLYGKLITPMLKAVKAEIPRLFKGHPEAPEKLLNYFYGDIDYYYFNPIEELELTRIGAVNPHGDLGRIPGTHNYFTGKVEFPTELLDVRFATGKYGELSRDTLLMTFDGGWAVCLTIQVNPEGKHGRNFAINAYLPVTPFGSYRDQVHWDPEA